METCVTTYGAAMTIRPWITLLLALGVVVSANAQAIAGRIVGVTDGDTITMLDAEYRQHKIRLDGIDAPEKSQAFGNRSKQHLSNLAFNREAIAECSKTDRCGRQVCRVLVGDVDVCLAQIQAGMAWHFKRYAKEQTQQHREQYASAELEARAERRGLWTGREPVAP